MVNYNPDFPEVLGPQYWPNQRHTSRVWGGAQGRMMRVSSTVAETIASLKLSATVDPLLRADTRTIIDVFEEGQEFNLPAFSAVQLLPSSDVAIGEWTTHTGATTNLFQQIDESATVWGPSSAPAADSWIQTLNSTQTYKCSVNASRFAPGGDRENSRIGFVELRVIEGANTGYRQTRTGIEINGTQYAPHGGTLRNVHGFGATYTLWYGEINPATGKPWKPADIADFAAAGTSRMYVKSEAATTAQYPKVYAMRLFVWCVPTENRVAVGTYQRPDDLEVGQVAAQTDALMTYPAGTNDWAKANSKNYFFFWRQSVCPSLYGPVVADDVRWNGGFQDLGPDGQPPGVVYPLSSQSAQTPAPATGFGSLAVAYDQFGRPAPDSVTDTLPVNSRTAYGLVMVTGGGANSVDSMPYRTDLDSLQKVVSGTTVGQRVTPSTSQSYLGVRFPVVPPATADGNITVSVHRVSDGVQMGGSFSISADSVRAIEAGANGWRYVSGFLASGASLVGGTQYEIRVSTSMTAIWYLLAPDVSLGASASFGGTGNCLVVNATANSNRDLCINLVRQPDPPTGLTAAITAIPCTMPDGTTRDVEHVNVSWTAPATAMGSGFARYELDRQMAGETKWTRIANITNSATLSFVDHLAPRTVQATYHIRAVGKDGRFSVHTTSAGVTPAAGDYDLLITSNHAPSTEVVVDQEPTANFEFRNNSTTEIVLLQGADYQVVFTEDEDRGISTKTTVELNFGNEPTAGKTGSRLFAQILAAISTKDKPHVCVLGFDGTKVLGHVTLTNASQSNPGHVYKVELEIIPTFGKEVAVEVS